VRRGQAERHSHDDKHHGTLLLFSALDTETGQVIGCLRMSSPITKS